MIALFFLGGDYPAIDDDDDEQKRGEWEDKKTKEEEFLLPCLPALVPTGGAGKSRQGRGGEI